MRKRSSTTVFFAAATALALLGGSACFVGRSKTDAAKAPEASGTPIVTPPPAPAAQQAQTGSGNGKTAAAQTAASATIYRVVTNDDGSHLKPMTVKLNDAKPGEDVAAAAINAMAKLKDSPLPPGTQARAVSIEGDVATVNLNKAFVDNFEPGEENEALAINSITATLGQFPGVKRVQFLIEGKAIDSLGGAQSLDIPLPVPQSAGKPSSVAAHGDGQ